MHDPLNSKVLLRVQWGISQYIPFRGFINLKVDLGTSLEKTAVQVPFLVTTQELNQTIFGLNVIKVIIQSVRHPEAIFDLHWTAVKTKCLSICRSGQRNVSKR